MSPSDDVNYNNDDGGDNGDEIPDDDMLVNKKTSFNGKLNKYFYHVTKTKVDTVQRPAGRVSSPAMTQTQTQTQKVQVKGTAEPGDATGIIIGRRVTRSQSSRLSTASSSPSENNTPAAAASLSLPPSKRDSSSSSSSPKKKKKRLLRTEEKDPSFSPPSRLRDTIPPNLILLLVGVNPGLMTGATGFAYAHPSNLFWKLLHSSGITTVRHPPSDTYRLPELYGVGNTNIVERPTRDASMLSKAEMDAGVPVLEAKIAAQRPEAVGLVGKSIWEAVWRVKHGRPIRKSEFRYGWQDESENMGRTADWPGARVFVATTTSGLAATMSLAEKQAVWNELGRWVVQRREERKAAAAVAASGDSDASAVTTPVSVPTSASPYFASTKDDSTKS
ncbi:hypothetical protein VTN96DRAFT_10004 [Rasamsonia emersonii]|uniref:G/T mismatch-specific thymine DNA glycosylase n=1 Tax=Rasamsonia emersonii (strain ATCC 16479 / CBS 393.64 / IMI 116815) TaxID=1408163 RepID=A0A0F4YP28_RASE3|nr:G/T mismatch-specific thymine DNA glycosylase [Rasamsonia emersonii CBS 393.64]KKA19999.1 G/T mismatch-specific thymine DNA glycosylase [Rasamsonia emersonii CBS 393.64]